MNKTTYNTYARVTVLLLFLSLACTGAMAQVTEDKYSIYTGANEDGSTKITHKAPKWTQYRTAGKDYGDTYDTNDMVTLENGMQVQAANAYVDTIYMHKGSSTTLTLPYRVSNNNASIYNYLRWFDYRTDSSYRWNLTHTGEDGNEETILDLLTPVAINNRIRYIYRFANGYVVKDAESGYVQDMMDFYYPTDEEFESMNGADGFDVLDNDYYIVACDASIYTDFNKDNDGTEAEFGEDNGWCEPTLAGSALYYIIGVNDDDDLNNTNEYNRPTGFEHYWNLLKDNYQGGVDDAGNEVEGKNFLFEYEIDYPSRRFSDNTAEMVALSKDAQAYAIPGVSATDDKDELDVTLLQDEGLGFNLTFSEMGNVTPSGVGTKGKISGSNRNIFFYKGTLGGLYSSTSGECVPTDEQWSVPDGSKITILVTKTIGEGDNATTYNLARFRMTFKETANLLTQTQVAGLNSLTDEEKEKYWWGEQAYRDSLYMETNYMRVASLTFDYDEDVNAAEVLPESNKGQKYFYPYPKGWDTSGYAFYDGSTADVNTTLDNIIGTNKDTIYEGARFSMYSITNDYGSYYDSNTSSTSRNSNRPPNYGKNTGGYWLYIDASEQPGEVAEITLDGNLCQGSKLYGTAWVKGAGGNSSVDAALLLTLMGVREESDGTVTHTPLERQCTGQIRVTTRITSDNVNEEGLDSSVTGKGSGTNEWFQVYFSFINEGNVDYDYYTVRVDNYCAGTDGGDYYFDEVKLYVLHPSVEMLQLEPICATSEDDKSAMRMDIEFESIMARLGLEPLDYGDETEDDKKNGDATIGSVDFVIINEAKYRNLLAAYNGTTDEEYKAYQEEAFKAALVTFYDPQGGSHQFPTLDFYCNYELNAEYDTAEFPIIDFTSGDVGYFYRRLNDAGIQYLSVECLTDMMAYTEYAILLEPHTNAEKTDDERLEEFIELLEDECAIKTDFFLSATTILKVNGETVDPLADYCAGQEFVISPEVTYTDPDTEDTIYIDDVYFDWFFGSRDEYVAANDDYGGVSLEEALIMFRTYYPDAEELSETKTPPTGDIASQDFTQDHYNIVAYYLSQPRPGGMNNMLVLHRSHLDMRVLDTGLELVIQPIAVEYEDLEVKICFGYVPLTLYASSDAPTLKMGFSNINYPDNDYEPCLRLGLAQFEQCGVDTPFTINLHGVTYITEADENGDPIVIDHLGVADGMDMLFLVDTDDPAYRDIILGKEDEEEIVIGEVKRLYAKEDNSEEPNDPRTDTPDEAKEIGSYMQIYFYEAFNNLDGTDGTTPFTVREGYYYIVSVYFQEKGSFDEGEKAVGSACWGTFPLEMKIVPEYLVWTGDSTCNWNNDNHWQRVSATSINGTKDESSPYFTDGNNENTNGFVPMLFTKVIMPIDSEAELYMAGFIEEDATAAGTTPMLSWEGDEDTENHDDVDEHPTGNIMYDLMLYDTEDAQGNHSLNTEHYRVNLCDEIHFEPGAQLLHSEQLIYNKAWTDVELAQGPWKLAATPLRDVVSGDWYTKSATGTETAEYFTDITFSSTDNDRLDPMVYQRNWSNEGNVIVYNDTGKDNKTVPAYASTGWSSVYNDASVAQQAGEGFSIKASNGGTSNLMFRFPKADASYTYYDESGTSTSASTSMLTRDSIGRLLMSAIVDRSNPDGDDDTVYNDEQGKERTITVELAQTGNGYYIIGNPYTAAMSMSAFMEKNSTFVGYWTEATYGPIAGTKDGTSWGTDDCLIAPYSAFFVTTNSEDLTRADDDATVEVTFTKDMQTFEIKEEESEVPDDQNPVRRQTSFAIRAKGEGGTTSAYIAYTDKATDDYRAGEDAMLMEDASWKRDGMPLVYSVAGDKAVSVNTLKQLTLIPIGAFADEGSMYTLSFVGVGNLDEPALVDTYEDTETPLTEGFTLEVDGPTHGRYYIRVNTPIMTDIDETESPVIEVSAYSPVQRTVVVSSDAGLENVEIYSVGGMLLKRASAGGSVSCTINGVASGIAIVKVKTTEGTSVKKIRVR